MNVLGQFILFGKLLFCISFTPLSKIGSVGIKIPTLQMESQGLREFA